MSRLPKLFFVFTLALLTASNGYAKSTPKKGKKLLSDPAGKAYLFGDYKKTLSELDGKKSLSKDELFLKARALYHLTRYDDAKSALLSLPAKQQKTPLTQYWLAHTLYRMDDKSGAQEIWKKLSQSTDAFGRLSVLHLDSLANNQPIAPLTQKKPALDEENFLQTQPAKLYKSKQYQQALAGFQELASKHPEDSIAQRYLGMTHAKLGNFDKAIEVYKEALTENPWNAALHMELARAYKKKKDKEAAAEEYKFVRDYDDSGIYSIPAGKELKGGKSKKKSKSFLPKKLKVRGALGWQWASNVKGVSEVPERRKPGDRNGSKYRYALGSVYELWKTKHWEFDIDASLDHSYFDDGFNEKNTYIHTVGFSVIYDTTLFGKSLKILLRQGESHVTKKRGWFSFNNATNFNINYELSKHYEFDLYDRWGYNKFDTNGNRKDITGKDGFTERVGWKQKYTPTKNKDLFFSLDMAYANATPLGLNGRFHAFEITPGIDFPIIWEVKGAFAATYKRDHYPEFEFPATRRMRRGDILGLDASLERDLTEKTTLFATYAYDNVSNLNASYRKNNHTFGSGLKFKL